MHLAKATAQTHLVFLKSIQLLDSSLKRKNYANGQHISGWALQTYAIAIGHRYDSCLIKDSLTIAILNMNHSLHFVFFLSHTLHFTIATISVALSAFIPNVIYSKFLCGNNFFLRIYFCYISSNKARRSAKLIFYMKRNNSNENTFLLAISNHMKIAQMSDKQMVNVFNVIAFHYQLYGKITKTVPLFHGK